MSQAFQFLLCNPLEARAADTFWIELAGTPGVLDASLGGFSLERSEQASRDQWESRSKGRVLILNLRPGHSLCLLLLPPPPLDRTWRGQVPSQSPPAGSFQPRARHPDWTATHPPVCLTPGHAARPPGPTPLAGGHRMRLGMMECG